MTRRYLKDAKLGAFGAFSNRVVGSFGPHMNVVYGENEAGKTTLASFVGGVLFGWEEARGNRNTYKPEASERYGSLFFAACDEGAVCAAAGGRGEATELSRARNADGLQGDASIVSDIDKETFRTMFSLTSDELRSLRNTSDVTARLLTAGSGTGASPALALDTVQGKLAEYTSRAAGIEHSLANLGAKQEELRSRIAQATEEAERYKRHDKELYDLEPQRDDLLARLDALNGDIEALTAARANVQKMDRDMDELEDQIADIRSEEESLRAERRARLRERAVVPNLTGADDRALRDQLESLTVEEAKVDHAVDLARDNVATSKASYDALLEADNTQEIAARRHAQRTIQIAMSIALPLVLVVAGVLLFIHGRDIKSLSFTSLGVVSMAFSAILATAAFVVAFRPDKDAEARESRLQDARWVMLQDEKKLEACQENQDRFKARAKAQLDDMGLAAAQGSLRRARMLLDEAKETRADTNLFRQREQALVSRRSELEERLASERRQRRRLFERLGMREERTIEALDALLVGKTQQRAGLLEQSERLNRRYGELKQELSQALGRKDFDALKLAHEQVRTRIDESSRDYARLLLAKRMLEGAIGAWESKSQPEVYRQASRLLGLMTDGRWVKVSMTPDGRLQVEDSVRTVREPVHLSLGTCQQLYLSLRIALLMEADNVGRSIPILADDILVNFDESRRRGAARALAELSRTRQVILFTSHGEIVRALREADPELVEVSL